MTLRDQILEYAEEHPGFEIYQLMQHMQKIRKKDPTLSLNILRAIDEMTGKELKRRESPGMMGPTCQYWRAPA